VLETVAPVAGGDHAVVRDEFPDLQLEHVLVDSCAMLLVQRRRAST